MKYAFILALVSLSVVYGQSPTDQPKNNGASGPPGTNGTSGPPGTNGTSGPPQSTGLPPAPTPPPIVYCSTQKKVPNCVPPPPTPDPFKGNKLKNI